MAAQRGLKRKKMAAKPKKDSTAKNEKIKVKAETANTPAKVKGKARLKSNKPLTKAQKASKAAQVEAERQRQARIKAEKALTQVQEHLVAARLEDEQERQAGIKRVSFVVRLTIDEHGQFGRTVIEHVSSSRKQNFLSLDGEHLVAFMKACISPAVILEDAISTAPPPEKVTAQTPGPLRPKASLIVSDVRVFRLGDPDFMALTLTPEEPFVVQARFQLQGTDAQYLTTYASSFEIKLYANEVTSGETKLLTTYSSKMRQDVLEYTAFIGAPGLPHGLYRLFTLVTLSKPIKIAGYHDGPVIQVM